MSNTHKFEYKGYRCIAYKDSKYKNIWDFEIYKNGEKICVKSDSFPYENEEIITAIETKFKTIIDGLLGEDEIELLRNWAKKADYSD